MQRSWENGMQNRKSRAWEKTKGHCWYCGLALNPFENFCIDHVVPKHHGGTSHAENLLPSCRRCNSRKGLKSLDQYREYLQKHAIPTFTEEQLAYLDAIGFKLPDPWPQVPGHIFWGEREH